MKDNFSPYAYAFLIGSGSALMAFFAMNGFNKPITFSFTAILFFLAGIWAGRLSPKWILLSWVLLNVLMLFFYVPMAAGMGPKNPFKIMVIIPLIVSLPGIALGKWSLQHDVGSDGFLARAGKVFQLFLSQLLLPLGLGLFGMFAAMFSMFLAYAAKLEFPVVYIAYPVIYMVIAGLLSRSRDHWLLDSLLVCLAPLLYWMVLLPVKKGLTWPIEDYTNMSEVMFVLMPVVLILAVITGWVTNRKRRKGQLRAI